MNKYQLLFIIDNSIDDEAKDAVIEKFSSLIQELGGTVGMLDKWGTRKYAYPINFKNEGYYVLMQFEADPTVPAEIDRQMRINDNVVRQLITKMALPSDRLFAGHLLEKTGGNMLKAPQERQPRRYLRFGTDPLLRFSGRLQEIRYRDHCRRSSVPFLALRRSTRSSRHSRSRRPQSANRGRSSRRFRQ